MPDPIPTLGQLPVKPATPATPAPAAKPAAAATPPAPAKAPVDTFVADRPRPPAPDLHGDDYAKPGVLGVAVTLQNVIKNGVTPAKVARAAKGGAQVGSNVAAGSLQGFFAAFKAGVKANAVVAGALSIVTNGYDALKGRTNMKQFLGLTAADTVAYTAIGALATATATLAPAIVGLVPALAVAGPVLGIGLALGVGLAGSALYGKLGHEPLKEALR